MFDRKEASKTVVQTSRRQFGIMGAVAAVAGLASPASAAIGKVKAVAKKASVPSPYGAMEATFIAPESGQHRGLVMWGKGAASAKVAHNLAAQGWAVLLVEEQAGDAQQVNKQARACVEWLESQTAVASTGKSSERAATGLGYGYTLRSVSAALPRFSFANTAQRQEAARSATLFAVPDAVVPHARVASLKDAARQAIAA